MDSKSAKGGLAHLSKMSKGTGESRFPFVLEVVMDAEVLIFGSTDGCYRCKLCAFMLEGIYPYSAYDVNKTTDKTVFDRYRVDREEDIPTFVILKNGTEIYRTQVPLSPARVKQLLSSDPIGVIIK